MTTTNNELVIQLNASLDRWNAEIDELEKTVRHMKAMVDQEYAERISNLKRKRDEVRHKLRELEGGTDDAGKSLRSETKEIWSDIKHTLEESKDAFLEGLHADEEKEP